MTIKSRRKQFKDHEKKRSCHSYWTKEFWECLTNHLSSSVSESKFQQSDSSSNTSNSEKDFPKRFAIYVGIPHQHVQKSQLSKKPKTKACSVKFIAHTMSTCFLLTIWVGKLSYSFFSLHMTYWYLCVMCENSFRVLSMVHQTQKNREALRIAKFTKIMKNFDWTP